MNAVDRVRWLMLAYEVVAIAGPVVLLVVFLA